MRKRDRGTDGRNLARAEPAVIAKPIDIEAIRARVRVDFETGNLPVVDADVGRKSLNAGIARARDVPFG